MNDPRIRAVPFQIVRDASEEGDGLTLEGYAAVFDETVRIWDPFDGEYDERFQRGAFKKTIAERTPYLMLQHGRHPLMGPLPIGSITELAEDSRGLHVRASLHDNWLVQPVRDAIASGSLSGMSIMFEPMRDIRDDAGDLPLITRTEVKLLELGPVVFPAYESTEVGVRSLADLNDLRRVLTKEDIDGDATPDEADVTSEQEADVASDDGAGGTDDDERSSVSSELLEMVARNRARRYQPDSPRSA